LTPPGSGCSIVVGKGIVDMPPGSLKGLQLVVSDIHKARAHLVERGVEVSEVKVASPSGFRPSREEDVLDNVGFIFFRDPDGNGRAVQQISARACPPRSAPTSSRAVAGTPLPGMIVAMEDQVSWRATPYRAPVLDAGGVELGRTASLLGDENEDIFHGLAVKLVHGGRIVELPAA